MLRRKVKLTCEIKGCFIYFKLLSKKALVYQLKRYSKDNDSWVDCDCVSGASPQEFWYIPSYEEGIVKGDFYTCWISDDKDGYFTNYVFMSQSVVCPTIQVNRNGNGIRIKIENYLQGLKYSLEMKKGDSNWLLFDKCSSEIVDFVLPKSAKEGDSFRCVAEWNVDVKRIIGCFTLDRPYQTLLDVLYSNSGSIGYDTNERIIDFDSLEGLEFEHYCGQLLRENGFTDVKVTKGSSDMGADIIAKYDGVKYAIQCKRYSSKVGFDALKEAHTAKTIYDCDEAVVLTNNFFSDQTKEKAAKLNVHLWDRKVLLNLINNIRSQVNDNSLTDNHTENTKYVVSNLSELNSYSKNISIQDSLGATNSNKSVTYRTNSKHSLNKRSNYKSSKKRNSISEIAIALLIVGLVLKGAMLLFGGGGSDSDTDSKTISNKNVEVQKVEKIVEIKSSESTSHYVAKSGKDYDIDFTCDGDLLTCWQDGEDGDGIGDELIYFFDRCSISKIEIVNGNRMREESFYQNNRLAKITINFFNDNKLVKKTIYSFSDEMIDCDVIELEKSITCEKVVLAIEDVYSGTTYSDTGVTKVRFFAME